LCGVHYSEVSNGKQSSVGPEKLNGVSFIHGNYHFITSDLGLQYTCFKC